MLCYLYLVNIMNWFRIMKDSILILSQLNCVQIEIYTFNLFVQQTRNYLKLILFQPTYGLPSTCKKKTNTSNGKITPLFTMHLRPLKVWKSLVEKCIYGNIKLQLSITQTNEWCCVLLKITFNGCVRIVLVVD